MLSLKNLQSGEQKMKSNLGTKDTSAWVMQVWISFVIACVVAGYGLINLPIDLWQKGYLTMGLFFTLGSTLSLAKTVRDNRHRRVDTSAWIFQVWASFIISGFLTAIGIYYLKVEFWVQGYAAIALLFVVTTAFTLAKTIRDNNPNEVLDSLDSDGDGFVSRSEASRNPSVAGKFDVIDSNKDGRLSREELAAMAGARKPSEGKQA
jgi:hypothetical protein